MIVDSVSNDIKVEFEILLCKCTKNHHVHKANHNINMITILV